MACIDRPEGGVRCRLILKFLVVLNHNKTVYLIHVGFIHIFITQFLTDGPVDVLLLDVARLYVSLGMLDAHVRDYCWNLQVG